MKDPDSYFDSHERPRTRRELGWMYNGRIQNLRLLLLGEPSNGQNYSECAFRVSDLFTNGFGGNPSQPLGGIPCKNLLAFDLHTVFTCTMTNT